MTYEEHMKIILWKYDENVNQSEVGKKPLPCSIHQEENKMSPVKGFAASLLQAYISNEIWFIKCSLDMCIC